MNLRGIIFIHSFSASRSEKNYEIYKKYLIMIRNLFACIFWLNMVQRRNNIVMVKQQYLPTLELSMWNINEELRHLYLLMQWLSGNINGSQKRKKIKRYR